MRSVLIGGVFVTLLAALATLPFLNFFPVYEVSEGREGVVVNEILSTGEIILPLRNGEIVPSKPVLFHWLASGFSLFFNRFDEAILRLPSALAGIGCILSTYLLLALLHSVTLGMVASLILLTTSGFYGLSLDGRVDMVFTFFTVLTIQIWLYQFARYKTAKSIPSSSYFLLGLLSGLAVLTKGPLGIVLPAVVIAATTLTTNGLRGLIGLIRPGLLLSLLVPAPWYIAATFRGENSFVQRQVFFENFARLIGGEGIVIKPFWFYLECFWSEAAPWSVIFLVIGVWYVLKSTRATSSHFLLRSGLVWFLSGLLLFSIAAGKRRAYLVPLYPGMAQAFACLLLCFAKEKGDVMMRLVMTWRKTILALSALPVIGCCLFMMLLTSPWSFTQKGWPMATNITLLTARTFAQQMPLMFIIAAVGLLLFSYFFFQQAVIRQRLLLLFYSFIMYVLFCFCIVLNVSISIKAETHSHEFLAAQVSSFVPQSEKLNVVKELLDESLDVFFFYFRRHVTMVSPKSAPTEKGQYLSSQSWFAANSSLLPDHMTVLTIGGQRVDNAGEDFVLFEINKASE